MLVSADECSVRFWNVQLGTAAGCITTLFNHISCFAMFDQFLLIGDSENRIQLFNISSRKNERQFVGHTDFITELLVIPPQQQQPKLQQQPAISLQEPSTPIQTLVPSVSPSLPQHTLLVSCSLDGTIKIWNLATGELNHSMTNGHSISCMTTIQEVEKVLLFSGSLNGQVSIWDLQHYTCLVTWNAHACAIVSQILSVKVCVKSLNKSDHLTYDLYTSGGDFTIKQWRFVVSEGKPSVHCKQVYNGHRAHVSCIGLLFNGSELVSGSFNGELKWWDKQNGTCKRTVERAHDKITKLVVAGEDIVCTAGNDSNICVWDGKKGLCERKLLGHATTVIHCSIQEKNQL